MVQVVSMIIIIEKEGVGGKGWWIFTFMGDSKKETLDIFTRTILEVVGKQDKSVLK